MFPKRNGAMRLKGLEFFAMSTYQEESMNVPIGVREQKIKITVEMFFLWIALHDGRGGGERVQEIGAMPTIANDGGAVGYRGEMKRSRKPVDIFGAGGLE